MSTVLNLYHHALEEPIAQRIAERLHVPVNPYSSDQAQLAEISGSDALILVLSKEILPATSSIKFWRPLLEWLERGGQSRVALVVADDCEYPPLLNRATVVAWEPDPIAAMRQLERWVWRLDRDPAALWRPHPDWLAGARPEAAERLLLRLADRAGQETVPLAEALAFAAAAVEQFQDVVWLDLGFASPVLARLLLEQALTDRRRLLLLHGYAGPALPPDYRNSILTVAPVPVARPQTDGDQQHALLTAAGAFPAAAIPVPLLLDVVGLPFSALEQAVAKGWFQWLTADRSQVLARVAAEPAVGPLRALVRLLRRSTESYWLFAEWALQQLASLDWPTASAFGLATISRLNDEGHKQAATAFCQLLEPYAKAANDQECLRELAWFIDVAIMPAAPTSDGEQMTLF